MIPSPVYRLPVLLALLSALAGCGPQNPVLEVSQEPDEPLLRLSLKTVYRRDRGFTKTQKALLASPQDQAYPASPLTEALLEEYVARSAKEPSEREAIRTRVSRIAESLRGVPRTGLKVGYEAAIEKELGTEIQYEASHNSPLGMISTGILQCYSGTALHEIMRRLVPDLHGARNPVIIASSGHVFPGYVVRTRESGWRATGGSWPDRR